MSSPAVQVRRALRPSAPALAKARLRVVPITVYMPDALSR